MNTTTANTPTPTMDNLLQEINALSLSCREWLVKKLQQGIKQEKAKQKDDTLMTKEEFFAKLDRSLQQAKEGKVYSMLPGESMDDFMTRVAKIRSNV